MPISFNKLLQLFKDKGFPQSIETPSVKYIYLDFPEMPVSAGKGVALGEECNTKLKVVSNELTKEADFAIKVSGDSMKPEYCNDDIVLVKKQPEIEIGEVGIFVLNGDGYIKEYGGDRLISLNKKYKDILLLENDNCVCVGRVIGKL